MTTEQLVSELSSALGDKLKSVVLYGSAAAGDFVPGVSGHDVLIVVEQLGAAQLAALAPVLKHWHQAGNPLPQLFTPRELAGSADVFPIELLDMQQSRRVLHGHDPLAGIEIDMRLFRIQLERELKTRLLLLRQRYISVCGQPARIADLLAASVGTFLVLLRACLRLYNVEAPTDKAQSLALLAEKIAFQPQPLLAALHLRKHETLPAAGELETLLSDYLNSIEQVIDAVDQHLHASTPK